MDQWNEHLLQSFREVGDPVTDPLVRNLFAERGNQGLAELNKFCQNWKAPVADLSPGPIRDFFEAPIQYPAWVDMDQVEHSVRLFYTAPVETILLLLMKSFPQTLMLPSSAEVFYRSDVFNPKTLLRFVIEIVQLIFDLMRPGSLEVHPQKALGVMALQKLRMHHSIIRQQVLTHAKPTSWNTEQGVPINQEDLAFGIFGFAIFNLDGFRKLGLGLTSKDEEATFMTWRVIGFLLGMDERLQPVNIAEGRKLLGMIAARQARSSMAGTVLVRQLLGIMESFLIFPLKALPVIMMRSLMSKEAIEILHVPRPKWWQWPSWIAFFFLRLLVREMSLVRWLLRLLRRRFLRGLTAAQGRQGQRGQFRIPAEVEQTYSRRPTTRNSPVLRTLPKPQSLNEDWDQMVTPPKKEDEVFSSGLWRALGHLCIWAMATALFFAGIFWDWLRGRNTQKRRAQRLRRIIQKLGPTAIKLAQQASMRSDIIPYAYAFELNQLLDKVPPFSSGKAVALIERATRQPLAATFSALDPCPIGSGSLACVYHAILNSGEEVAVKVRRPGAGEAIATDLRALKLIFRFLELVFLLPAGFTRNILYELGAMLYEELDFSREARNMELFSRDLRRTHYDFAHVPRVYFDLSDRTVLVQEYVSGVWLKEIIGALESKDYAALATLRRRDINPKLVARRLLLVSRFGGFEGLLFHADLHPANVLVGDGNQITLVDFGACGSFTKHEREVWRRLLGAQNDNDVGRMAKAALALIEPLPPMDIDEFTRKLEAMFFKDLYATKSKHAFWWERTSANLWISFLRLAREYEITLQLNTLRMIRVTMLADTIALRLDSSIDNYHEYRRYEKQAGKRAKKQIRKRIRRFTSQRAFVSLEQLFDTGGDIIYAVQRLLNSNPFLGFASLAGKAAWAFDTLLKSVAFVLTIDGTVAAVLWLLHSFFPSGSKAPAWIYWLLQDVYKMREPVYFLQILRIVLNMPGSIILIMLTVLWTFIRMHKRLDDVEIES